MSKEEVQIDSIVNELYAKTKVTQKIRNETENPLELRIYFEEDKKSLFTSFSAELGDLIKANLTSEVIIAGVKGLASAMKSVASGLINLGKEAIKN